MGIKEISRRTNWEILRRINREVSVRATRFANTLLTSIFRAIFHIEKSYEFTAPEIFELEHEPDRILWKRLDEYRLSNLPIAIANEEVLASRYQVFTEYDFVVVADVSHSMVLHWWGIYGGKPMPGHTTEALLAEIQTHKWKTPGDRTKLFLLKYTLAAFLHSASANKFFSYTLLFGGNQVKMYDSRQETHLEESILERIDEHYENLVKVESVESPQIVEALRRVLARRRRAIVLCISDFMDTLCRINDEDKSSLSISDVLLPLAEISARHRLLVLRVNHNLELEPQEISGTSLLDIKGSPYLNGETSAKDRKFTVNENMMIKYPQKVSAWNQELRFNLGRFGIRTQELVAGKHDEHIDRKICELGLYTGR